MRETIPSPFSGWRRLTVVCDHSPSAPAYFRNTGQVVTGKACIAYWNISNVASKNLRDKHSYPRYCPAPLLSINPYWHKSYRIHNNHYTNLKFINKSGAGFHRFESQFTQALPLEGAQLTLRRN